jgi:hypothetical protein
VAGFSLSVPREQADQLLSTRDFKQFQNATRQLGSSIGLLSSAYQLRQRLFVVLHLFRENAESLFPKYIKPKPEPLDAPAPRKSTKAGGPKAAILRRPTMNVEKDAEDLPAEMGLLAQDVMSFLHHLEEFPEFIDEAVNASITAFQHDLKVRTVHLLPKPLVLEHFFSIVPTALRSTLVSSQLQPSAGMSTTFRMKWAITSIRSPVHSMTLWKLVCPPFVSPRKPMGTTF